MSVKYTQRLANDLSKETYTQSVSSINMGFTLAAALAWNESIKKIINANLSAKLGSQYQILYAVIVTLLAALVFVITKRFLKPSIKREDIKPIIGMM